MAEESQERPGHAAAAKEMLCHPRAVIETVRRQEKQDFRGMNSRLWRFDAGIWVTDVGWSGGPAFRQLGLMSRNMD